MVAAVELHGQGLEHLHEGRYKTAQRTFLRALKHGPDVDCHARILISLAMCEAMLGEPEQGLALCRDAATMDGLAVATVAVAKAQGALIASELGAFDVALCDYRESLKGLAPGTKERANTLVDYGNALAECHQLAESAIAFEEAAHTFEQLGDDVGRCQAMHNLGCTRRDQGDLAGAVELMDEAYDVLRGLSDTMRAYCTMDRASVHLLSGNSGRAISLLREAAAIFGRHRVPRQHAECELLSARAHLRSDPAASARLARQAARRLRRHGNDAWALRADSVAFVARASDGHPPPPLWFAEADTLSATLRENGLAHQAQLVDLHAAIWAARHADRAHARFLVERGRTRSTDSLTERLLERQAKAELARAGGRRKDALHHLRVGLDLLQNWQASFGSLDLMSSVAGHGRDLARLGIEIALGYGDPALVFEWSERARSLATRVIPVRPPDDPEAAADLVEIRQLTVEEPRPGSREARRLAELRERVSRRAWLGRGSGQVRDIASLDDVRVALGLDTALVSFLWDGTDIWALLVTDEGTHVESLCADWLFLELERGLQADLDMSAASLSPTMAAAVRRSARDRLDQIGDLLIAPLLDRIDERRVVITQAGVVSGVPWGMLAGLVGRPLTVAPTASSWLAGRGALQVGHTGFVAGPRVPRAEEEVTKSASSWPRSVVLCGEVATVDAVVELASSVDLLHVSAHGRHASENPLFSGVELADGPLYGYDIDRLRRVPTIVVLSACEVGRSTQRWVEESLGMVNAWLHAGARCVVASPAAVADDRACELLQDVHRQMAEGVPPAHALAAATAEEPSTFMCFGAGW